MISIIDQMRAPSGVSSLVARACLADRDDSFLQRIPTDLAHIVRQLDLNVPTLPLTLWSSAPYHNATHCFLVTTIALALSADDPRLTQDDRLALFYAGMFHDAGHPGLNLPDVVNIRLALQTFDTWLKGCAWSITRGVFVPLGQYLNEVPVHVAAKARQAIEWTSYPYQDTTPDCLVAQYLRDADILVMTHPARKHFLDGLAKELGKESLTEQDNAQFLSKCRLFTEAGRSLMACYLLVCMPGGRGDDGGS